MERSLIHSPPQGALAEGGSLLPPPPGCVPLPTSTHLSPRPALKPHPAASGHRALPQFAGIRNPIFAKMLQCVGHENVFLLSLSE